MKANELRIGNFVECECEIFQSTAYTPLIIERNEKTISPIPLTHEWLERFGFEKSYRIDFGEMKECYGKFSFAIMIRHNSYFVDWVGGNTEIKYVHQLQNLYFALTGSPLKVDEI